MKQSHRLNLRGNLLPNVTRITLSGPYNGLGTTIAFARRVLRESPFHPEVRAFAEAAVGRGPRDVQARRLFKVLKDGLNYVGDTVGTEYTKAPWVMIQEMRDRGYASEDCDGQATLSYTLLNLIGIPAKLRVAWYDKPMPQHIYTVAWLNGRWVAFDTTARFGVEPTPTKFKDFA